MQVNALRFAATGCFIISLLIMKESHSQDGEVMFW